MQADDIIGTLSKMGEDAGYTVDIVTGDRDLTQLASDKTTVLITKNDQFIALTKDTTAHIQNNSLQSVEELHSSTINGVKFEEYLKSQIATIGENLVVRRFASLKASANGVVNGYIHTNGRVGFKICLD